MKTKTEETTRIGERGGAILGRGGRGTGVCLKRGDGKNGKSQGINKNRDGICENKKVRGEVYETKKENAGWEEILYFYLTEINAGNVCTKNQKDYNSCKEN